MASALAGLGHARRGRGARRRRSPASIPSRARCTTASRWRCRRTATSPAAEAEVRRALAIDPDAARGARDARRAAGAGRADRRAPAITCCGRRRAAPAPPARPAGSSTTRSAGPRRRAPCSRSPRWRGPRRSMPRRCASWASICSRRGAATSPSRTTWRSTPGIRARPTSSRRWAWRCWSGGGRRARRGRWSVPSASTGRRPSAHLHLAIAYVQIDRPGRARRGAARPGLRPDYPQARGVIDALARGALPKAARRASQPACNGALCSARSLVSLKSDRAGARSRAASAGSWTS